jgi:hypothetical protein
MSFDEAYAADAGDCENRTVALTDKKYFTSFTQIPDKEKMTVGPYHAACEIARPRIADFARRLDLNEKGAHALFDHWIFDSGRKTHSLPSMQILENLLIPCGASPIDRKGGWSSAISLCISFHPQRQNPMLTVCHHCKETSTIFREHDLE